MNLTLTGWKICGVKMATNNAVMQEDQVSDKSPALAILSGSCKR